MTQSLLGAIAMNEKLSRINLRSLLKIEEELLVVPLVSLPS